MVTSGYQFFEFAICAAVINMPTEHQTFGKGCGIQKIPQKVVQLHPKLA